MCGNNLRLQISYSRVYRKYIDLFNGILESIYRRKVVKVLRPTMTITVIPVEQLEIILTRNTSLLQLK